MQRRIVVIARTDGTVDRLPVIPKVEMRFERTYKVGVNRAFTGETENATNLYRMAWELDRDQVAAAGGTALDLDRWIDDIVAVEVELEDIRPTASDPPAAASPSSASSPG
jgi:hypothetical protein